MSVPRIYSFVLAGIVASCVFVGCLQQSTSVSDSSPLSERLPLTSQPKTLIVALGDSLTRGADPKNVNNTGKKGYVPLLQEKFDSSVVILNCGIGGQTSAQVLDRLDELLKGDYSGTRCTLDTQDTFNTAAYYDYSIYQGQKPSKILLMVGSNDARTQMSATETLQNLRKMLHMTLDAGVVPLIATIPTIASSWATQWGISVGDIAYRNMVIEQAASEFSGENVVLADVGGALSLHWNEPGFSWDGIHVSATGNSIMANVWANAVIQGVGKKPLANTSCTTGTGYKVFEGLRGCSCADRVMYVCTAGAWVEEVSSEPLCTNGNDSNYILYHCENYQP